MKRGVFVSPEIIKEAGDAVAGILLAQIIYWNKPGKNGKTKLRIELDGVLWIAKTREEWMAETGLTEWQIKRALSTLKRRGLIETRIKKYKGNPVTHLRLLNPPVQSGDTLQTGMDETSKTTGDKGCDSNDIHPHIDYYKEYKHKFNSVPMNAEGNSVLTNAGGEVPSPKKSDGIGEKIEKKEEVVDEELESQDLWQEQNKAITQKILEAHKDKKWQGSLSSLWLKLCCSEYGDVQKPLTVKEMSQLKMLRKYLGDLAAPVIHWVIPNWWEFKMQVAVMNGLTKVPLQPNTEGAIGFLLKHHAIAVNLMEKVLSKVSTPTKTEEAKIPYTLPIPKVSYDEGPPATKEEILAALAEFS